MIKSIAHSYTDGHDTFIGRLVRDDARQLPMPGVIIAPAFGGLGPFEEERAEELAKHGYAVLAVDYYGNGKRAQSEDEAFALMADLNSDRPRLARRMAAALDELKDQQFVDETRTGAMGYCFGGKAVLDLARSGADFQACVSLHGVYDAPQNTTSEVSPAVLILHGWEDPLATPQDLQNLSQELTAKCQDWQILAFGHVGHAFTNPTAQKPEAGMVFSAKAAKRSWKALTSFFDEHLGTKNNFEK